MLTKYACFVRLIIVMNNNDGSTTQKQKVKKPTNRDVARLAGVSVATVSYIVNGREDQRISEATKKKVYQAINFLNYAPNPYAVGLNTNQPQSIVVRSSVDVSPLTEIEILHFMRSFNKVCETNGYTLNYSMDKRAAKIAASACICFGMPKEEFYTLCEENFIPVVAIDSLINDPIFYQITPDYDKLKKAAQEYFQDGFSYVCITPHNAELQSKILSVFPDTYFISSIADIKNILPKIKNVVLSQPSLFEIFDMPDVNVFKYDAYCNNRAQIVFDCIIKALDRLNIMDEEHFITL